MCPCAGRCLSSARPVSSVCLSILPLLFSFSCYGARRDLHSFPTRRSSDLRPRKLQATRWSSRAARRHHCSARRRFRETARPRSRDRKSTRLNSSHVAISYAVFCLKKKRVPRRLLEGERATNEIPPDQSRDG